MRSGVAVSGTVLQGGQELATSIQNGLCRSLISQGFLPKGDTNRRFRGTLRNKRFSRASDTTGHARPRRLREAKPWANATTRPIPKPRFRLTYIHSGPLHAAPWMWTLAFGHHEDRTPTHGYESTREAANASP